MIDLRLVADPLGGSLPAGRYPAGIEIQEEVPHVHPTNSIISDVHNAARWPAGPFDGIFSFHSAGVALAVNRGLAAVVYLIAGGLIARLPGSRR